MRVQGLNWGHSDSSAKLAILDTNASGVHLWNIHTLPFTGCIYMQKRTDARDLRVLEHRYVQASARGTEMCMLQHEYNVNQL